MSGLLFGIALAALAVPPSESDAASALERAIAEAERQLQSGALAAAESRYREALFEGWALKATLERVDGRREEAQEALRNASLFRVESPEALRSLAALEVQLGDPSRAVEILTGLASPRDPESLRLLAKALAASGRLEAAVEKLDAAAAAASDDAEQTFLVATEYLWLKRVEAAERLFARVVAARPLPQTHVLIGRSYRDAGESGRAIAELRKALAQEASVRRAHYYLGMVLLADATTSADRLEGAIAEFREELKLAPRDPLANDQLGLALLDAGRPAEALPALEIAVGEEPRPRYLQHLARAQLALDRPAEAVDTSRRALEIARTQGAADADLEKIHYQLGLALRKLGRPAEAAPHLAEARAVAARAAEKERVGAARSEAPEASPLADLPPAEREELRRRVREGLARACFNLGVLQTQIPGRAPPAERFSRAAAFFERTAALDPDFPSVQGSLGIAYFNARQFDKAAAPLERAVAASPAEAGLRRMLALALINTKAYEKAVPLLQDDPQRSSDASLQTAYGLALLRSGRPAEAEKILGGLARQGESAELLALVGEAQAAQRKYELAIASLERALRLSPGDASVHDQLGHAYQKVGRTELANQQFEASRQLRAKP